jgi:hypothetical protein
LLKPFQNIFSVHNSFSSGNFSSLNQYTADLSAALIRNLDDQNFVKRLRRSKSVGLHAIPDFVKKVCIEFFISVLKLIYNLCLTHNTFLKLWKPETNFPLFKKGLIIDL